MAAPHVHFAMNYELCSGGSNRKKASVISVTNDSKAPGAEYKGEKDPYWTVQSRVLNVPNPLLHRDWNLANLLDGKNFAVI